MYEGLLGPGCLLLHVGGGWMYRGLMKAPGWGYGCVLIIMVSLTCRLLLEVRRSWEKTGEKAETESSKSVSHFEQQNTIGNRSMTCFFSSFFSLKESVGKKIMFGMKEVTRPLVYLAFNALHEHKKILSKTTHQLPFREQPWSESVNKMKICIFLSGKWIQ